MGSFICTLYPSEVGMNHLSHSVYQSNPEHQIMNHQKHPIYEHSGHVMQNNDAPREIPHAIHVV